MLKFKNKFKFGSSNIDKSPENSQSLSPRNSTDSRKTISVNNLSENVGNLNIKDEEAEQVEEQQQQQIEEPAVQEIISNPGLLTIKIYNSNNIKLPIQINNNKQILNALANNATNESTQQQLNNSLTKLDDEDLIPGSISTNYLPANITIPNGENLIKSLLYLTVEFDNNVLIIEPQRGTVHQSTWNQVVSFDVTKKIGVNNSNFLNLNLFIRLPNLLIPQLEKLNNKKSFTNNGSNIGDLLIGSIKLPINLKNISNPIRLMNHDFLKFNNYNLNLKDDYGEIMLTIDFKPLIKPHLSIDDFDLLKVIGKGSFGKVMQVIKKDTKQIYALKTLRKQHIISRMEVTHTLAERTVLARITNPFIVPLKFSFQSPEKLYLVLSFINGGELFWHLQKEGKFSMDRSRFYIAELLTALESLHELNVIYRDLKPENILLDYQGHIALCDFGLCKLNMSNNDKTNTFCGTPEYLAPELLLNQGYTRCVDWWTLGTLLYEMLTGLPPFYDDDVSTMYRKILQNPLKFPSFLENTDVQDLLIKLLQKDPSKRLNDAIEIKNHNFFKDIDWNKLLHKNYLPPFKPNVENLLDTSNFDQDFTNEKPQDSVVDDFLSESVQKQFGGWTYNGDNLLS
ncbi:Pkinase-domain-containing protein [Hyphopichia burtonii NRRL Y-1933]|uniref:non-specific serine/threonine protein kinase n=1 Tax=Hyphopichia burtonii NRRL Y-1933 TaxID=984485 RepID=A0A1E4RH10_9ASCO|nr:Pkinase-domain-containing protein [Hyphopichia burtonii NRRL Y-1933]ODV66549.1 Pkinase-domain-containing protein [Hyphopichia burtonii NRRL Y-1933]